MPVAGADLIERVGTAAQIELAAGGAAQRAKVIVMVLTTISADPAVALFCAIDGAVAAARSKAHTAGRTATVVTIVDTVIADLGAIDDAVPAAISRGRTIASAMSVRGVVDAVVTAL